ncbi:hypothetical protein [Streptomyces sp. NPDC059883]|uniref:hypothetical protein n=1 Tax=unclassified Streptomyces TaxID=2593676 RepID=UPI0036586B14
MRRVVRGFWGPREESAEALAGRWKLTLDRLAGLLTVVGSDSALGSGAAGSRPSGFRDPGSDSDSGSGSVSGSGADAPLTSPWTWRNVTASGPVTELRPDEASLLAALRAAQAADGWSDRTGCALRLVVEGGPGWKIEVSGLAGGTPEFLLQSMVIGVSSPDEAGTPEPGIPEAEFPDAELLCIVAELWEPDFGGVTDDDVLDALEDDAGFAPDEPSVGWIGYLSPGRAALLPEDLAAVARTDVRGGGALLVLAARGDTEDVLRANLWLREAGALRPLPRPMDRAAL